MTYQTEGEYRVDVGASGEHTWATNALRFGTVEEATAYANDLLGRWMGADLARVVSSDTPDGQPIDLSDEDIVVNWRR